MATSPVSIGSAAELQTLAQRLRAARKRIVARHPSEIAAVLARVAELWLEPGSVWMERAVSAVSAARLFSRPMLEIGLPRLIEPLRRGALEDLVRRELGGWESIGRATGPHLALHVLPSNLPGHAAIPSALTLVMQSAALLKPGRDDRVFSQLWVESIRHVDAEIGECVSSVYWPGGERAVEDAAMSCVDLVVASGGNAAVEGLRGRCNTPFVGHGPRVSFALVCRGFAREEWAAALAGDVAIWDQRGCLSPQVCFVEGDRGTASSFAAQLCAALTPLATALPPGWMSTGEILEVRRFRDAASWRGFGDGEQGLLVVAAAAGSGSVAIETELGLQPTPLRRCIRIVPIGRAEDLAAVVAPRRAWLEAAGVAAAGARRAAVVDFLHGAGVHHVVTLGEMQKPDLSWRQGGRPRIAEWARAAPRASTGETVA